MAVEDELLTAPYLLSYDYRRSCGPVIGRFLAGLRDQRIEGVRTRAGRVIVPPVEYDPDSGEATGEFVEVSTVGTVMTWAWVAEPRAGHPLQRPFAWALIKLGRMSRMQSGARVKAKFAAERSGHIRDLACFELEEA